MLNINPEQQLPSLSFLYHDLHSTIHDRGVHYHPYWARESDRGKKSKEDRV